MTKLQLALILSVTALVAWVIVVGPEQSCLSKWSDSTYSYSTGCLVNVKGEYIPEANIRVIKWEYTE